MYKLSLAFSTLALAFVVAAVPTLVSAKGLELSAEGRIHADAEMLTRFGKHASVIITNDGDVAVRNATVTGVSGSTITAQSAFGPTVLNWTVNTGTSTKFIAAKGAATTTATVRTGDTVSFLGMIDRARAFTVNALLVLDRGPVSASSTTSVSAEKKDKEDKKEEKREKKEERVRVGWFKAFLNGNISLFSR